MTPTATLRTTRLSKFGLLGAAIGGAGYFLFMALSGVQVGWVGIGVGLIAGGLSLLEGDRARVEGSSVFTGLAAAAAVVVADIAFQIAYQVPAVGLPTFLFAAFAFAGAWGVVTRRQAPPRKTHLQGLECPACGSLQTEPDLDRGVMMCHACDEAWGTSELG